MHSLSYYIASGKMQNAKYKYQRRPPVLLGVVVLLPLLGRNGQEELGSFLVSTTFSLKSSAGWTVVDRQIHVDEARNFSRRYLRVRQP